MKSSKKLMFTAGVLAAIWTFMCTTAYATVGQYPLEFDSWKTTYNNLPHAPSNSGSIDNCYMKFSFNGIKASLLSLKNTVSGATGTVSISVENNNLSMPTEHLSQQGQWVVCKPTSNGGSGGVSGVYFRISSYTEKSGNSFTATGTLAVQ